MKKLAIVALALVLAMTFVGCDALGEKTLLGTWVYDYGSGKDYWEFKEEGLFVWSTSWAGVVPAEGKWVYANPDITIKDFKPSYNGVWTVDFVSANEMKWTIVSYDEPTFKDSQGKTNAEKQVAGENFTLTRVVEDAE